VGRVSRMGDRNSYKMFIEKRQGATVTPITGVSGRKCYNEPRTAISVFSLGSGN
jgi:hypothetical protein